jgi:hypothetical protein
VIVQEVLTNPIVQSKISYYSSCSHKHVTICSIRPLFLSLKTYRYKSTRKGVFYLRLHSPCESWPLFQFLNPYTVDRTPLTGDQPDAWPLPAQRTAQTQNKRTQTSMSQVGFEPTIPAFERTKTGHALDGAATVIGKGVFRLYKILMTGHRPVSFIKCSHCPANNRYVNRFSWALQNPLLDQYRKLIV